MTREKGIVQTSIVGIVANIFLVIGKAIVGILAHSISIITDAINNLTDAFSSTVTIVGTKIANKKPDKKHPYGHGRAEIIASSIIGVIIFTAGFMAIYESILSLINQDQSEYTLVSFIIIPSAIVVKIGLGIFFRIKGKKYESDALKASGLDALLDALLSVGTLTALFISYFAHVYIEGYVGIAIGLFILKSSFDVLRESISKIIGERSEQGMIDNLMNDIASFKEVRGVYDLILNNYGYDKNIGSVHVEVDDKLTAREIQVLEREIAMVCYEKYHIIMTVGIYASNEENEEDKLMKEKVYSLIKSHYEIIQVHGFFVDHKKKFLSVDIIIDFATKNEEEMYNHIKKDIENEFKDYTVYVVLDKDYSVSK